MQSLIKLTLKVLVKIVAEDILKCFSSYFWLYISSEASARQIIHMKCQALLSQKIKIYKDILECCLMPAVTGTLRFDWHFNV